MALTVSAWATTNFSGEFFNAYQVANKITDNMVNYSFTPGTNSVVDKIISNRIAANNSGELAVPSVTETAVTTTADAILVAHEYVPYAAINTEGGQVPGAIARKLAAGLAHTRQLEIVSYGLQQAISNSKVQQFDDETTDGSTIYGALQTVWGTLMAAGVPETDLYCVLEPTYYAQLRKYAPSASRDYIAGPNNADMQGTGFSLFGMQIVPSKACFGINITGGSTPDYSVLASKYKYNFSATTGDNAAVGFVWHRDAMRVHAVQKPAAEIVDSPEKQSWLVRASEQFGTGIISTSGIYCISRD